MPRRVVWYPAGSPAASLLSALPGDLEAMPLPARGIPRPGPDEGAVALVDLTAGDARAAADLAARAPDLPVVALASSAARYFLRQMVEPAIPNLFFLSHNEVPPGVRVVSLGVIP